jgi:hypothetical protein
MEHDNLTIVSVCGHNNGASAIPAIQRSMQELPGSLGLLLSPEQPDNLPDDIEWWQIGNLSYLQYSVFMMHSLHQFIHTDFCLVVQDDGWVLDGKNWQDSFYDYDYIGSPCHAAIVGNELQLGFTWIDKPERIVIQNGGFSLRSKRFLQAPNVHGITHVPAQDQRLWNEDVQLSGIFRPIFEVKGYKFASESLAKQFGIEYLAPDFHDDLDLTQLFGHHAPSRKLVSPNHVVVDSAYLESYKETDVLAHFQNLGYTVEYVASNHTQA